MRPDEVIELVEQYSSVFTQVNGGFYLSPAVKEFYEAACRSKGRPLCAFELFDDPARTVHPVHYKSRDVAERLKLPA